MRLVGRGRAALVALAGLVAGCSHGVEAASIATGAELPVAEVWGDERGYSPDELFAAADLVIIGMVVSEESAGFRGGGVDPADPLVGPWTEDVTWTFAVEQTLKGEPGRATVQVTHPAYSANEPDTGARVSRVSVNGMPVLVGRTGDRFLLFLRGGDRDRGLELLGSSGLLEVVDGRVDGYVGRGMDELRGLAVDELRARVAERSGVDAEPVPVSLVTGLWASSAEDAVFWSSGCRQSRPPQCSRDLRIVGLDPDDLAALPSAASAEDAAGAVITWLDASVRLVATYDRAAATLTLTQPPASGDELLAEQSDAFAGRRFLGDHRPAAPCRYEPGSVSRQSDAAQQGLAAVHDYLDAVPGYVHLWFAQDDVLVVQFADDPAEHAERLRELYPGPVCTAEVPYTAGQLEQASDAIADATDRLRDAGVLLLTVAPSHRGLDVEVFLADAVSTAAIHELVDPTLVQHVHVVGLTESP